MLACAEAFAENLTQKNLRFELNALENGDNYLSIIIERRRTDFFFSGDDDGAHVFIRTILEKCPQEKMADLLMLCNQVNMEYRWVKFYVDRDNDVVATTDAVLSPETAGEECFEILLRTDRILNDVKPRLMRVLYA